MSSVVTNRNTDSTSRRRSSRTTPGPNEYPTGRGRLGLRPAAAPGGRLLLAPFHNQGEPVDDCPLLDVNAQYPAAVVHEFGGLTGGRHANPFAAIGVLRVERAVRLDAAEQEADAVDVFVRVH